MQMKKGFTLVEVMIVVAIIGLLCAIAIPNFFRARFNDEIKNKYHIKNDKYIEALYKESNGNIDKAKRLLRNEWRPVIVETPITSTVTIETTQLLVCPKCKYVFGKYKLVEDNN